MTLLSAGVEVKEIDLSNVVPSTAGVMGAFAGAFQWGPVMEPVYVTSEKDLKEYFGKPKRGYNRQDWFTVAAFLSESNQCWVTRVTPSEARNAIVFGTSTSSNTVINNQHEFETQYTNHDSTPVVARYPGEYGNGIELHIIDNTSFGASPYADLFDTAPDIDEYHVVINKGSEILETYSYMSLTEGATKLDGTNAYIPDVLNTQSGYVYVDASTISAGDYVLEGGVLGAHPGSAVVAGYDLYQDTETYADISLVLAGATDSSMIINQKVLDIASSRKDCVGFISPQFSSVVQGGSNSANAVIADRQAVTGDSYGFMGSQWFYIYDKYNKTNVWVPDNGYIAALVVKTELERDAWFAPAGFNRGKIRGVIKPAWTQPQAIRDLLYKNQVNPITTFRGEGLVLFGQKTLQAKPSAFDRLNVRRLFLVLERAISRAAKYQLFEMNNAQTQMIFRNMVNPFLRNIKAKQGIQDFKVICDDTNNTDYVKNHNQFVANIVILPQYSIEFIELSFTAVGDKVTFSEVVGK